MKKYELLYIIKGSLDETAKKAEVEKTNKLLTDLGAKITKSDEAILGLRDLAYPIKGEKKGYYVDLKLELNDMKAITEFDRLTKINSNIIRYLFTVDKQ